MDTKSVKDAVHEATRFLKAAKAWHERMEIDLKDNLRFLNTREGGALRRASMDLTRALAAMRKY